MADLSLSITHPMENVHRIYAYPAYAKKGDPCVAKAMVVKSGDTNFLCDFVVKDTERGHGIGTRLLEMLIDKYRNVLKPMHDEFIEPTKQYADIIIPNGGENARAVSMMQMYILSALIRR